MGPFITIGHGFIVRIKNTAFNTNQYDEEIEDG
jgi:hypothetical protein